MQCSFCQLISEDSFVSTRCGSEFDIKKREKNKNWNSTFISPSTVLMLEVLLTWMYSQFFAFSFVKGIAYHGLKQTKQNQKKHHSKLSTCYFYFKRIISLTYPQRIQMY